MTRLTKSLRDFFTPEILKLAFLPFILSLLIMYALFFLAADYALDAMQSANIQIEQQQSMGPDGEIRSQSTEITAEGGDGFLAYLLQYGIVSWLLSFFVYTLGSFFVLILSVFIALFIIGFLTPPILRVIAKRHYHDVALIGHGEIIPMIGYFLKSFLIMAGLFLLLIPFYFIPLLGVVALNLPFYYLFHKMMVFDVASTITTREEYRAIMGKKGNAIRLQTLLLYLLSLIPFAVFFTTAFFVIYLGHTFFAEARRLRSEALPAQDA